MKFATSLSGENFQTSQLLLATASEAFTDGEGLVVTSGRLTKAGPTVKPQYISASTVTAGANTQIPVYPVVSHHVYEATFAADATAVAEGTAVTLHTDGSQITATAASGVATIVKKLSTGATGTKALVRIL